jgi:hypothetical protein
LRLSSFQAKIQAEIIYGWRCRPDVFKKLPTRGETGGVPGEAQSGNQLVACSPDIDDFYGGILAKMFSEPGDKYIHGSLIEEIIIPTL